MSGPPRRISETAHLRLIGGVALMLALFLGFGIYVVRQAHVLRRFQSDVLERNRKDTLQLLRLQQDAYLLAVSVRDMVASRPRVPIPVWGAEFRRLRLDLNQALKLEAEYALLGRGRTRRQQLDESLQQFWTVSDQAFALARRGFDDQAERLVVRELNPQQAAINNLIARWLAENDQDEQQTQAAMRGIYDHISREFVIATVLLLGAAVVIAVWALGANRSSFERVQTLAAQLDEHSRRLEEMSWRFMNLQEETLQQVSRDLHDEFGQILTALGAVLARLETRVRQLPLAPAGAASAAHGGDGMGELAEQLRQARSVVQDAQRKIRSLSQVLRPAILDDFGLQKTLEWYAAEFSRRTGLKTDFECNGEVPYLDAQVAIHLYRIAQEALNNAAKHAHAHRAWLRLEVNRERLSLRVQDDGQGFDAASAGSGVGLTSMRERVARLGGSLNIKGNGGTLVEAEIPLTPQLTSNK